MRYDIDSANRVAELCEIPVIIVANAAITTVAPSSLSDETVSTPLQLTPDSEYDVCLMRSDPSHSRVSNFQPCPMLFGGRGNEFPDASIYAADERVRVNILSNGKVERLPSNYENSVSTGGSGSALSEDSGLSNLSSVLFGMAAGLALYTFAYSGGGVDSLSWQPHADVYHSSGSSYYAYGSRLSYAQGEWSGYWEALQTKSDGTSSDWVYGAGTRWTGEILSAAFENNTRGLDSNTFTSLSAHKQWGVWRIKSSYVLDLQVIDLDAIWSNSLGFSAEGVYDKWSVTPRVNFTWDTESSVNDDTFLRLDVRREL